ncbi:MAG: Dimethyladenosine transferase methylation [Sphingomonas bacterium]|uniref:class I SAM-dependent methyltransferase n=1 Tax=Sphingomonas bacterium TaxID=1895847 RepID=UPI002624BCFF|nr:class I SAM-dependent methyltransferase [Sphingomonas bacterium]MDB5708905.1 Dimethyladenosine transferase methylation [Sphingomonas bacterium]
MSDPVSLAARLPRAAGRTIFGSDVAGYHSARPGYPAALYRLITARLPAFDAIAEIGPGTGLATEALAAFKPRRFVAFEPDPVLAAHLRTRFAELDVINDDFCAAEVAGGFDLIASASSFHWLDPEIALPRARALLKPGGCLAIWWNVYRQKGIGDPFAEAVAPLLADIELPPSEAAERHYSLDIDLHRGRLEAAGFGAIEHHVFRRERVLSADDARALYASFSLVRLLPSARREALLDAIAALVTDEFGGAAPSVLLSPIYLATAPA